MAKLGMVATAMTKMIVMPASRMLSAISFGVFLRCAPSTSAIMRSRKVEPGDAVMRTLIQSEITCVPPVTAERSPPASRMTGADSPVIAASLTEATPSITSPSDGMMAPASTKTTSPGLNRVAGTVRCASPSFASSLALVSVLLLRNVAACALPRPSATASAKLANSRVNHSQTMICNANPTWPVGEPVTRSRRNSSVVSVATTSTQNITGLRDISRGSSLRNDWPTAGSRMAGSSRVAAGDRLCSWARACMGLFQSEQDAGIHRQVFDDGAEGEGREEGQAANDQDHAGQQADEQGVMGREGPGRDGRALLGRQRSGDRQHRHDDEEAANQHGDGDRQVVPERVAGEASEGAAIVRRARDVGVERLGEAVRSGVRHRCRARVRDHGDGGPAQHHQRQAED